MPKPLTFAQKRDRFPPVVVRLLARHQSGHKVFALTDGLIQSRSGLSLGEVRHLSRLTSWGAVEIDTFEAFCRGCGADLDNRDWLRKNSVYMGKVKSVPRYLRKSPEWSTTFEPLISIWVRHETTKAA